MPQCTFRLPPFRSQISPFILILHPSAREYGGLKISHLPSPASRSSPSARQHVGSRLCGLGEEGPSGGGGDWQVGPGRVFITRVRNRSGRSLRSPDADGEGIRNGGRRRGKRAAPERPSEKADFAPVVASYDWNYDRLLFPISVINFPARFFRKAGTPLNDTPDKSGRDNCDKRTLPPRLVHCPLFTKNRNKNFHSVKLSCRRKPHSGTETATQSAVDRPLAKHTNESIQLKNWHLSLQRSKRGEEN